MQQDHSNDESLGSDVAALFNEALQHYRAGRLQQAQIVCHRILRTRERPDAILILAKIAHEQQDFKVAVKHYQQFLGIVPDHSQTHYYLGVVMEQQGRIETAIEHYEMSISLDADNAAAHSHPGNARIELARLLRRLGRAEEAILQLEQAIDQRSDDIDAHVSLASTHRQLGQEEFAVKSLEQLLRVRPTCGEAYYHISMIRPEQELIPAIEEHLDEPETRSGDAAYRHFALGRLYDRGKHYDRAFGHFLRANELRRDTFSYDASKNRETVDRLIAVYSNEFPAVVRQFGSPSQKPVFIVGMPRSGTTLVEQILSSHALVHGAGEVEAFHGVSRSIARELQHAGPAPECMTRISPQLIEDYSARYLQELMLHSPSAERITDKLPGNYVRIGLIKTLLPEARIILCERNPLDNCASLFFHCFPALTPSFELTELGQYYLDYQRLMSHWQDLFPGEIHTVKYEDLVVNQESVSKQLIDYVGLNWDEKCMDFHNNERTVMSPSNMQVRQPMYKSSINRWKIYEKQLQPLVSVLQPSGQRR